MEINYEETKKILKERVTRIKHVNTLTIASMGIFTIIGGLSACLIIKEPEACDISNICITAIPTIIVLSQGINLGKNLKELKKVKTELKNLENYRLQKRLNR